MRGADPEGGSEPAPGEPAPDILRAIRELDPEETALWTAAGAPRISVLEAALGRDVDQAERDTAWRAHTDAASTAAG